MTNDKLLNCDKRKILNIIKSKYIKLDFSKLSLILDNNFAEPTWMDAFTSIYKNFPSQDVLIYNILIEKLSVPFTKFYFKSDNKRYIVYANEFVLRMYTWYLTSNQNTEYFMGGFYIPEKEYIADLLKYKRYEGCGISLTHIEENKFEVVPLKIKIESKEEAKRIYEKIFDAYDLFKSINLKRDNFIKNYGTCEKLGRDKRMTATLSTMASYFYCNFEVTENYITILNTNIKITDEESAKEVQAKLFDTFQFFRNVVNAADKKDIISEVCNKKLSPETMKQFSDNMYKYINVTENRELTDWIVTISKESKYTLNINFDDQGVFYIDNEIITTPLEAKEFYISYMNNKKDNYAMTIYQNNILGKIKKIWNIFRSRFAKKV